MLITIIVITVRGTEQLDKSKGMNYKHHHNNIIPSTQSLSFFFFTFTKRKPSMIEECLSDEACCSMNISKEEVEREAGRSRGKEVQTSIL